MNKNYMIFPMNVMRITQSYLGNTSHFRHTTGTPKDYPIDCAGADTGRDAVFCPCDEMMITEIKGYNDQRTTNTIWLTSTRPATTPTFTDTVFMTLTHENDSDLANLKVGQKFKRGDVICYEGTSGTTANHIHIVVGRGSSNTWVTSSTGSLVIYGDTKKPEEVFFVDKKITKVVSTGGLQFKELVEKEQVGTPVLRDVSRNQLEVLVSNLNARSSASLTGEVLGYVNPGIYNFVESHESDGYTWYNLEGFYVAYQPDWITLYPFQESTEQGDKTEEEEEKNDAQEEFQLIFESKESKYYKIYLKEHAKLYLKKSI